jgi:AcrR family transcriptional regulator
MQRRLAMSSGPGKPDAERHDGAIGLSRRPNLLADQPLPAPPQQERSRRARDALLASSLTLFSENGYEATTVDEITRRAGVAIGGFYLHFRSKRQVLQVLMDALLLELDARLGALYDASQLPEQLLSLDFDSPYAGVYRAWREAALGDASITALDAEIEAWTSARIAAALQAALLRPGARATIDLQSFAWILSVLFWQLHQNARPQPDELKNNAAALVQSVLFEDGVLPAGVQPLADQPTS